MAKNAEHLTPKQNFWQAAKFALFSLSAGAIQIVSFTLCLEVFHWAEWAAYLLSLVLSVLYNFTVNRRFTFKSAANVPIAMLKVAGYYAVFAPLSTWWTAALNNAGWNAYVVEIGTMATNLITEYLFCRFVVYRGQMNTNELAKKEQA